MPNENLDFPQAPPPPLADGDGDTVGAGGGEADDRSSLERLWGDELYEEEDDDDGDGDIEESDIGGDDNIRVRNGEDLLSIRKECFNLNQRIVSRDEEVKQFDIEVSLWSLQIRFQLRRTKSFLAKQISEADSEREEIAAVRGELAGALQRCDRAEREKGKLMEEV